MLAEKTLDNTRQLKKGINQRRNGMEDLYGICFSANADATNCAKFYISLSPDYVYLHRFAFKLVIKPYASTVYGMTSGDIDQSVFIINNTSTLDESLSGGGGSVNWGIKKFDTDSQQWKIEIDGVDITDYLMEQHNIMPPSPLINGMGIYPNNSLYEEDKENFYDILDVVSVMIAEDTDESRANAKKILRPTFKPIEISSNKKFGCDLYLYLKYSIVNR